MESPRKIVAIGPSGRTRRNLTMHVPVDREEPGRLTEYCENALRKN